MTKHPRALQFAGAVIAFGSIIQVASKRDALTLFADGLPVALATGGVFLVGTFLTAALLVVASRAWENRR
ncbi:hypothetical protein [Pelagerythrobacter sp.]|uniref:hypothetical protein n=1 Tax=Pelagerythrobacter sp. TaxID=2800702 RepID=UPI0035B06DFF